MCKHLTEIGFDNISHNFRANPCTLFDRRAYINVTKVKAEFPHIKDFDKTVSIDYTASDLEIEFFHATTRRLKQEMDDMLDGLVDFQIDEYYTTQTLTTENFHVRTPNPGVGDVTLYFNSISEISEIKNDYDACLVVTDLGRDVRVMNSNSGVISGGVPFDEIRFDSFKDFNIRDGRNETVQLTNMLNDPNYSPKEYSNSWGRWIGAFLKAHAHIFEERFLLEYLFDLDMIGYSYGHVVYEQIWRELNHDIFYINKLYYTQRLFKDDKIIGIPYEF